MTDFIGTAVLARSVLVGFIVFVAWFDVRERRIPNALVFPAAIIGISLNSMRGWSGFWFSGKGMLVGFALLFIPYLLHKMGAGDVKFLAAIGTFVGAAGVVRVLLLSLMAYPVLALFFVIQQQKFLLTLQRFLRLTCKLFGALIPPLRLYADQLAASDNPEITSATSPFGLAVSVGTLLALYTNFLQ